MRKIFYQIFYRVYCWNIYIIKEKDLPILSSFLSVSALMGINIYSIMGVFSIFIVKDVKLYPDWIYLFVMFLSMTPNYFIFILDRKYKNILIDSEAMNKPEKKKRDVAMIIYIIITILFAAFVSISANKLKIQQGILLLN